MTTDGPRAHGYLLGYEPLEHYGACWHYVWMAYAAAGASTSHGALPTAYEAWQASEGKHYDMDPPEGAAVWLGRRYDGNMAGDVFIAGSADGKHAATDQATYGQTGLVSIRARMDLCGREYLGWTSHVLDVPINTGEDDDMPSAKEIAEAVWNYPMSGGSGDNAVPNETGGQRLREVRRSTDNLKHRTIEINDRTKDILSAVKKLESTQSFTDEQMAQIRQAFGV